MSSPFTVTQFPKGHRALELYLNLATKDLQGIASASEIEDFKQRARANPECINLVHSGPTSWSGGLPYVKPTIEQFDPLAKALGLDREGGWKSVWKEMEQNRERLCKLVWKSLEWASEINCGNTFCYCFCTKYLPLLISAVIEDPSPSVFATPYDLVLRGAAGTQLLQFYLVSRPDQAVRLRNAYQKKISTVAPMKLDANACFTHLLPHLPIIHTSILSFKTSPLSTPSQRNPPPPSIESPSVQYLVKIFAQIARFSDERWEQFSWPGALDYNCMAVKADMCGMDIQMVIPGFFTAERAPMGVDWSTCAAGRVEGCTERDPKKMKACSRCRCMFYCCTKHQAQDWKGGMHKPLCQPIIWDA